MTQATHQTAPNLFIEAPNGVKYAYRRFGGGAGVPLLFLQHFRGNMDNWDPALTDAIAAQREIILFDNTGVSSSSGVTPNTIVQMARDAIVFIDALGLPQFDLLGFSIGSFVAQDVALLRPTQVRRLVLAAAAPQGGPDMHGWRKDILDAVGKPVTGADDLLYAFFAHTKSSHAKGVEFLGRFTRRKENRDPLSSIATRDAQYDAVVEWGIPDHAKLQRLSAIRQPTLVANGDTDLMILPRFTHLLGGLIPNAEVHIYPDSAHGFLFQYAEEFGAEVNRFLDK